MEPTFTSLPYTPGKPVIINNPDACEVTLSLRTIGGTSISVQIPPFGEFEFLPGNDLAAVRVCVLRELPRGPQPVE